MDRSLGVTEAEPWWVDAEARERARAARDNRLAWLGVIALSFLVFKLTANPALTTAVGCLKFGWDDFRVYLYLRNHDPDPIRARINSRFYLAAGSWKVSAVAIALPMVLGMLMAFLEGVPRPPRNRPGPAAPPHPAVIGALMTAFFGIFVSSFLTSWALIASYARRVRVWVGPEVRRAREERSWPPRTDPLRPAPRNRVGLQITCTAITWIMTAITLGFLLIPPDVARTAKLLIFGYLLALLVVILPLLVLAIRAVEGRRIIAASPEDCWGTEPGHAGYPDGGWHGKA